MKTITQVVLILLTVCMTHTTQAQKEKNNMAALIWSETYANDGDGMSSRGWTGTSQWNDGVSFHWETDSELNSRVLYWQWSNGKTGMPDGNPGAIHKSAPQNNGLTIHTLYKFSNMINNGSGLNCHTPLRSTTVDFWGNSPGEIMLLEVNRNGTTKGLNIPRGSAPVRSFWSMAGQWRGTVPPQLGGTGGGSELDVGNPSLGGYLEDDKWYEVAVYFKPDTSGTTAALTVQYREFGAPTWTPLYQYTGFRSSDTGDYLHGVGLGPYLHANQSNNPVRMYVGPISVYEGDAISDGTLDGGTTEPADPLAISNHKVSATDTTAALTWTTNKPSNSVVDYGATETRGTIARDDNNVTDHTINLSGLTANTAYYYRFSSRTADGETVMDRANSTFMTKTTDNGGGTEPEPEPIEGSLDDLTDVALNNPVEGQVLMYRDGKWVNVDARPLVAQLVEEILGETSLVVNKPSA